MKSELVSILNYKAIAILARDPLYRNSFFIAFTSIFTAICGLFFWIIAAKFYTLEEVGRGTALISSIGLVTLFSGLGLSPSIIRFFPSENKAKVLSSSLVITTAASLLLGAIFIFLVESISPSLTFLKGHGYALVFLIIAAVNSITSITGTTFIADRKADYYLFQNMFLALRIPLLIPLAFLGAFGILGSLGLSSLMASFFAQKVLRRSIAVISPKVDMDFIGRSFRFSSWSYASNILSTVPTMILPIMIMNMLGEAEAAKYYIAFAIGNMILIIPQSLSTSLFVEGSYGEGLKKGVMRASVASFVLLVPPLLMLFLFGERLLGLLRGEYVEAFGLLRLIALSSFLVTIYTFFITIQRVRMRVGSLMTLNAISCVLSLGLSYVFIQHYGIIGVGYGWMATYGIIALVIAWMAKVEKWV